MKDYKSLQNGTDIRGVALKIDGGKDVNLTSTAVRDLAWAFATWLSAKLDKKDLVITVGRDSRITGSKIAQTIVNALEDIGVLVYDFGMATTPAMFMSTVFDRPDADGAIMITASHLPMERNGLKFFTKEGCLEKNDISFLIQMAENMQDELEFVEKEGKVYSMNFMDLYCAHLRNVICKSLGQSEADHPLLGLHIVVDAGNGAGGFFATKVLDPLGADTSGSQFLNPDGHFPNHEPNPENKAAMESVSVATKIANADLGLIFDTDVDRAAAVGHDGREIARNRIVGLAAYIASQGHPGTTIVTDSITSTALHTFLEDTLGCKHLRFKRGYKNVIDKGLALNNQGIDCQLSIETSGHAAMKENYFLDDGAYLATKIVVEAAKLKKQGKFIEDLLKDLADPLEATEVRFKVEDPDFGTYAQGVLDYLENSVAAGVNPNWNLEKPNFEGVRVNTESGWFLIRKSLHDPVMPLNIESDAVGGVEKTLGEIKTLLSKFDKLK